MGKNNSANGTSVNAGRGGEVSHNASSSHARKSGSSAGKKFGIAVLCIVIVVIIAALVNSVIMPLTGSIARVEHLDEYDGDNALVRKTADDEAIAIVENFGGDLVPEQTLAAYKLLLQDQSVNTLKLDLHITADGELVILHDHDVDRTSDGPQVFHETNVTVGEKTLKELKTLNFGYNFVDKDGNYPYRPEEIIVDDEDEEVVEPDLTEVRILELGELLDRIETYERPADTLTYYIEIMDKGESGKKSVDALYEIMQKFGITSRAIIGSQHSDVTKYIDEKYSEEVARFASMKEVIRFYYAFLWKMDPGEINYSVMQISAGKEKFYDFATQAFIDYAHVYDIAVQYKDVNDADSFKRLVENGADGVITNDPNIGAKE